MREFLKDILVCPHCQAEFQTFVFSADKEEIIEGLLHCQPCAKAYPIVNTIPRILEDALQKNTDFLKRFHKQLSSLPLKLPDINSSPLSSIDKLTQKSFGFQWTNFSQMSCDFKENFLYYIYPQKPSFFMGKTGLDAGCGFGRHIYNAAQFGSIMVGMDFSQAIDSTHKNTKHLKNVHLVQADIYKAPFKKNVFDFVYSIGVLHHLSDPEGGFKSLVPLIKPRGAVLVWVYSSRRKFTILLLEALRHLTTRVPLLALKHLCFVIAGLEWLFFLLPYKILVKFRLTKALAKALALPRIKLYAQYPFQVSVADWFDRLAAPVRFYYSQKDLGRWLKNAGFKDIQTSETGLYGIRGFGIK